MKLLSQMSLAELQMEIERLRKEMEEKQAAGEQASFQIAEKRFFLAKSYYMGTDEFLIGKTYKVHGYEVPFTIDYFNGVFAWGHFSGSEEQVGFPVGMLKST